MPTSSHDITESGQSVRYKVYVEKGRKPKIKFCIGFHAADPTPEREWDQFRSDRDPEAAVRAAVPLCYCVCYCVCYCACYCAAVRATVRAAVRAAVHAAVRAPSGAARAAPVSSHHPRRPPRLPCVHARARHPRLWRRPGSP